jgi:pyruvyl transferase EpsO
MSGTPDRPDDPGVSGDATDAGRLGVRRLATRLLEVVGQVFPSGRPWTLVDYPMHYNCGDAALFLGAEALARGCGARVTQVLDRRSYSPRRLDPDTVAVIQAGGNWGGLYQTHHDLRLRVLEDRDRPVVQLPQSVEYATPEHRDQLRRAVAAHRDFTLLVRDQRSFDLATRDYDCPVVLVPDTVFALGPLRRDAATVDLVVQGRTDQESASNQRAESFATEHGATVTDWLETDEIRPRVAFGVATRVNAIQRRLPLPPVRYAAARGVPARAPTTSSAGS